MKILVTGGAGFIGSALCRHLIGTTDAEIINVDKLTYAGNPASLYPIEKNARYRFIRADIKSEGIGEIFESYLPDAVIHLAAESHVDRSITGSRAFIETNILGTYNMLEMARWYWAKLPDWKKENFRFLHVSTDEVYGSLGAEGLFTEETPYDPSSPYSASKAASDHLAKAWHRTYGLPVLVSNCSNNYGPCQFPEKLIPHMILNTLENQPLPVYGSGCVRDFFTSTTMPGPRPLAAKECRETYNIGRRNERTNLEELESTVWHMTSRPIGSHGRPYLYVADRPGHDIATPSASS
jgi:dTDP-glucose 4,6-dehydratase